MFRRSSNNVFIPPKGLNSGSFAKIGNSTDELGERYPGLLGATLVVDDKGAAKYSDTSVGTLYNGVYQLVKLTSNITRGQLLFWDTLANNGLSEFEVTSTSSADTMFRAGVAICAGTSGEYCWIQVAGLASCEYVSSGNTATAGRTVVQNSVTTNTVKSLADNVDLATTTTAVNLRSVVGIAYEAPVASPSTPAQAIKRVLLSLAGFYPNIA